MSYLSTTINFINEQHFVYILNATLFNMQTQKFNIYYLRFDMAIKLNFKKSKRKIVVCFKSDFRPINRKHGKGADELKMFEAPEGYIAFESLFCDSHFVIVNIV